MEIEDELDRSGAIILNKKESYGVDFLDPEKDESYNLLSDGDPEY